MKTIARISIGLILVAVLYIGFGMYSMIWSERLLHPVKKGMSQSEVLTLVGNPIAKCELGNGATAWNYNRWFWTDAVVYFDTGGRVSGVEVD